MFQKIYEVSFPGGKRVDAATGGLLIQTDQSRENGGEDSAPEPFQLFLASIATCAGIYALGFCQTRALDTEGLALRMRCDWDENKKLCTQITLELKLPPHFPEKYKTAILKSMDQCTVKRHLKSPPEFALTVS
jgi:ribosomal protein S12 methylthiotransferase accessory factor